MTEQRESYSAQAAVHEALRQRGYVDPYPPAVFAWRQILKATEELGELAAAFRLEDAGAGEFRLTLEGLGAWARSLFDLHDLSGVTLDQERVAAEAADLQVVLFNLAERLGIGDLTELALQKSKADIGRGVRGVPLYRADWVPAEAPAMPEVLP